MTQPTSKRDKIFFWVSTGLFSAFMLSGAIPNMMSAPQWVEVFEHLGYPLYLLPAIGAAKLVGVIILLIPGYPRIKEWAYAGFFFDLTGATFSGLVVGGFNPLMLVMFFPYITGGLSYVYHHRRLGK